MSSAPPPASMSSAPLPRLLFFTELKREKFMSYLIELSSELCLQPEIAIKILRQHDLKVFNLTTDTFVLDHV